MFSTLGFLGETRRCGALVGAMLAIGLVTSPATAQRRTRLPDALRGSKESVQKMWDFAQSHRMPFYLTPTNIDVAIKEGRLVALTGDSTYELTRGVGFSYATREAKQFVLAFAPQYLAACGTPLTVTSAARPTSRQPHNANPFSVHPTGIAVDLRRPTAGPCQTWVRNALAELEARGFVEATEERHPAHLHVAVLTEPGRVVTLPQLATTAVASRVASPAAPSPTASGKKVVAANSPASAIGVSNPPASAGGARSPSTSADADDAISGRTYRVREGDTLWDVARRTGVSVSALARENHRSTRGVLRPGVTLRLPQGRSH
ncbi:MAG: Peptidase [Gemmatimonadetes bacterium]|nr:Peptidase [Gemmatimonadota bacterium]